MTVRPSFDFEKALCVSENCRDETFRASRHSILRQRNLYSNSVLIEVQGCFFVSCEAKAVAKSFHS